MTIDELIIITGLKLDVQWNEGLGFFQTWLRHNSGSIDVKDGQMLRGVWGKGDTRKESIEDYCLEIQGQTIVINAFGKDRQEINLPPSITYTEEQK